MAGIYKANPWDVGGFQTPFPGGSSSSGYYQGPLNIPFNIGRSILATIPEYQRNPFLFEKDLMITMIEEGRANLMKILLEDVVKGKGRTVKDVRYRLEVDVKPLERLYLKVGQTVTCNSKGVSKIKIDSNQNKIATAVEGGNPKQVGDIARLEVNQFILLMFSWVEPRRTDPVSGNSTVYYNPGATSKAVVPEIAKIIDVDYEKGEITVVRQWAGDRRASFAYSSTTVPNFEVVSNTTTAVWGTSSVKVPQKFAFILPMAKSIPEDELEGKVKTYSTSFRYGMLQRSSFAFGSQYLSEVVSKNLGLPSKHAQSRELAIKEFYNTWEWTALFGEMSEYYDPETGYWQGTTQGLFQDIPKSHYIAIRDVDWTNSNFAAGNFNVLGSFNVYYFNKLLEDKAYFGSGRKRIVCGSGFYTSFTTMINYMTQNVPDIKSEWAVKGKVFQSSSGLTVEVIPSDRLDLNNMRNLAIMYDPDYFISTSLEGYPTADIIEVDHENPLKKSGFIHGMRGFIDLNPDAHWVFITVPKTLPDGTDNSAEWNSIPPLGKPLE